MYLVVALIGTYFYLFIFPAPSCCTCRYTKPNFDLHLCLVRNVSVYYIFGTIYTGHFLAHQSYRYTFSALDFTQATFQHSMSTHVIIQQTHTLHSISAPVVFNTQLLVNFSTPSFYDCYVTALNHSSDKSRQPDFTFVIFDSQFKCSHFFDTQCLCVSILTPTFFFWAHPDYYLPVFFVINHISLMCFYGYPISNGTIFRSLTY